MTLPTGQISFSDLNTEFGGGYSLSSYYKNGSYVRDVDYAPNDPTSGAISLSQLQGAKKNSYNGIGFTSSQNWTVPSSSNGTVDVYIEGGGGGGGVRSNYWGGYGKDGGNGGIGSATLSVSPNGTYYVEVGGGGGAGHYGYGYKDNPFADGYPGGGGGQTSFNGLYAGGGGGGSGGTLYQNGPSGGGGYGGAGATWGTLDGYGLNGSPAGAGGASANSLGWGGAGGYGDGGTGGHYTSDNSGGDYGALSGPAYANGQQGVVYIYGYW
jgi:hypothetical protein